MKNRYRGVPGLSQGIIFAVSLEIPDPTSFLEKKKGTIKSHTTWFPSCHHLYLLTLTFLKSSWEGAYVVSGDTFPKKIMGCN